MKHKEKKKHLERKLLQKPAKNSKCRRGKLDFQNVLLSRAEVLAPAQDHQVEDTSSSSLGDFPCRGPFLDAELQHSSEEEPGTYEVVPSCLDAGETFSASEQLPCISSPSSCTLVDQDGLGSSTVLLNQDVMETENSSFTPHSHVASSSASNPSMSSVSTGKKRIMNVYYKPVLVKRGVAALEDTEDLEPPPKMMRIGTITCPERIPSRTSPPPVPLAGIQTDGEDGLDIGWQEESEVAEKPPEDLAQEGGPSAQTPAGPEDLYSGFRCMGCCQVFPRLQILKKHLEHGAKEGVSCLNLTFSELENKRKTSRTSGKDSNITTTYNDVEILLRFLALTVKAATGQHRPSGPSSRNHRQRIFSA
ncbi:protein FAM170A-like [Octodon degus]|uniref:Protein FAM170A-like n=1 Tax=Octodon degus TaxID=10160 RepID=A0A6P6E9U8_OCTDE|nr:protein FAM170A-like [Octodon degus]